MNEAKRTGLEGRNQTHRALSLLGMARAAGELMIGQDQVFGALRRKKRLFMVRTEDCSKSVVRHVSPFLENGSVLCVIGGITREDLGQSLGVGGAQIAALYIGSGFAVKLSEMLRVNIERSLLASQSTPESTPD